MSVLRRTPYRVAIIMEKKIIACGLIMLLLVTCFVACGKKPTIKGKNGMEYVVVTDEEGSSVLNADGDIAVYVTDDRGRYVKDANGERQTNYIEFPDKIINGSTYEAADFTFTISEGWTLDDDGTFTKDGTNGMAHIKFDDLGEVGDGETLHTLMDKIESEENPFMDEVRKIYDVELNTTDVVLTDKNVPALAAELTIKEKSGELIYRAHGTYFISNGKYYEVVFTCDNLQYSVSSEELLEIIDDGLTLKD